MNTFSKIGEDVANGAASPIRKRICSAREAAESILHELAGTYLKDKDLAGTPGAWFITFSRGSIRLPSAEAQLPNLEAKYRALLEQLPAVVFMAYLDRGIGEAYVSPQIEATLGFSQAEWLEDPVRWYQQIHPDDKDRWSMEAAEMFLSGKPLRVGLSGYRARWACDLVSLRSQDDPSPGRPSLVHSRRGV